MDVDFGVDGVDSGRRRHLAFRTVTGTTAEREVPETQRLS
jgi:hypothetical protein